MIDLTPAFKEGMNNLQKWRNRYSTEEYPYKVALNFGDRLAINREKAYDMEEIIRIIIHA